MLSISAAKHDCFRNPVKLQYNKNVYIWIFYFNPEKMKRKHWLLILVFGLFLLSENGGAQTLELREICHFDYQTDYTSIADRNKDDLFPKGSTVGFVHFYRGISLLRQRSYRESIVDFKHALADTTVSRSLCNLYLGIAFMQLNMPDSILIMYSKAMNVPVGELKKPEFWDNEPYIKDNTFGAYLMGTNNAMHNPTDTLLIEALFNYATKDETFYDAFVNYGCYSYNIMRYAKSINFLLKAREQDQKDDSTLLLCMGYLYRLVGDNNQSIKSYDLLLARIYNHAAAFNNRGCVNGYLEKYNRALGDLNRAVSSEERMLEPYWNRGIINLKIEKFDRAIENFNTVIQLQPNLGDAYYYRGFAKKASGDLPGSVADFTKALQLKKK
jgi:tetratricopeptide (TPR) repeat protein